MLLFPKLAGLVLIVLINGETPDSTVGQTVGPDGPQPPPTVTSDPLDITVHETPDRVSISTVGQTVGPDGPQPPPTVTSDPLDTTVQAPCILTLQPPKVVVKYGDKASANCSTTTDHIGMGWEASQGPVDMKDDVQLITWSVDSLVEWGIKPFCFMNPNPDKQCKVHLNVTIYKTPESVSISTVNHTGPMIEGGQYELQCDIQNVAPAELLTVSWFKGDTLVNKETFANSIKTPVNRSATLQISPSRADDGAQYRCEAELDLGPEGPQPPPTVTSDPLNITVHYKPVIDCSNWTPLINTSLDSFPFAVMGKPQWRTKWHQGTSRIPSTKRLSKKDSGQYSYCASNKIGSECCATNITVEYGPEFDCPSEYESREHTLFLANCNVTASPEADVSWSRDGRNVERPHNLTRRDNGLYKVTAQNKHGTEHHVLTINVLYGPEIESGDESVEVYEGRDVTLSCTTEGNPEPEVKWSFNNQSKTTGGRQTTLTISGATPADGGEYTCTATNTFGSQTKRIFLVVKEIPDRVSISFVNHNGQMTEDEPYELQCDIQKVSLLESLTVNWFKEGTLVKSKTFTKPTKTPENVLDMLQITPSINDNGAHYRCEAKLDLGTDGPPLTVTSDALRITVQSPCILTLQPPKVVVKYGDKASANCSTNTDHIGMGWEASQGPVDMKDDVQLITWSVDSLVDWGMKPFCFMNPNPDQQCKVHLNVTIYKTPESVSISTVNHTGPMIEGGQYELQCDIQNVAPAELLTVSWFKGDTLVNKETFANSIKTPVNRSSTLQISPSRADDGGQYRCEAELDLGPEGPQPPPTVTSDHLNITVHYGPEIESGDESVEVYEGRDVTLPCTAEGNPEPEVKWSFNNQSKTTGGRQTTLTISGATPADGGEYTCTATNTFGSQTRRVFLVVKDDRPPLPLIISISLIILLIVIFIICIIICKKKKQSGKYDVQPNDKGLQMMLL
uniref:Ig-like domain-containing protein n=1 Tax=Pygocentrus nattereri TaxID=42514 RepID=A0AAR2K4T8_PYGNA